MLSRIFDRSDEDHGKSISPQRDGWRKWLIALLTAVLLTFLLDALTNVFQPRPEYTWDYIQYIDMSQNGIRGNPNLVAPFAFRPVTPLLAGSLQAGFGLSVEASFLLIARAGICLQLVTIFLLADHFKAGTAAALVMMAVVAFSFFNAKYLLFDPYRPDHLAYPLLTLAFLALLRRQKWLSMVLSLAGVLIREFVGVPAAVILLLTLRECLRGKVTHENMALIGGIGLGFALVVFVPRTAIPVSESIRIVEVFHPEDPSIINQILLPFRLPRLLVNIAFVSAAYCLPLIMIAGRARFFSAWRELGKDRLPVLLYTLCVMLLTLYGGTDVNRFVSYLFLPQVILLTLMLRKGVPAAQIIVMLAAVFIFNRVALEIPWWDYNQLLDFYGGYFDRFNQTTVWRIQELVIFSFVGIGLRGMMTIYQRQKWAAKA